MSFLFVLLSMILMCSFACAESPSQNNWPEEKPLKRITLQLKWKHQFQFAGYYMAQEKGFYKEKGMSVNMLEAQPGIDPVQRVVNGDAEFGVSTSSLLLYRERKAPVVVLAVIYQHSPLVFLMKKKNVKTYSLKDMVGKKVMVEPLSDDLFAYLKKEKVDPKSLELVTHHFDIRDLIDDHIQSLSAYSTTEPFWLEQAGIDYVVFNPRAAGIDFYGDNLFTTEEQIKQNPEQVQAFREASLKGWSYALSHPEETIRVILSKYSQRMSYEHLWFEYNQMLHLLQPDLIEVGYMNTTRWQHIAETYATLGMFPTNKPVDPQFFYDYYIDNSKKIDYMTLGIMAVVIMSLVLILGYIISVSRNLAHQITRRERAERILKNNEEKYRAIYEYAPLVLFVWDKNFKIIDWNRYAEQLFGWTREEMAEKSITHIIPDQDHEKVTHLLEDLMFHQRYLTHHSINYNRTKDGRLILCEWENSVLKNDKGEVFAAMSLGIDITEKHKIQQALLYNEEKYRHLLEMVPFPIVIAHLHNNQIVYANHQAECYLEIDFLTETQTKDHIYLWTELISDPMTQHKVLEAISNDFEISEIEIMIQNRKQQDFWVYLSARLTEFENFPAILIAFSDISERKVFEQALQASQRLLENVLDNMEQAMVVLDAELCVVTYNKQFQQMFRFCDHELYIGIEGEKVIDVWLGKIKYSDSLFGQVRNHFEKTYSYSQEFYQCFKEDDATHSDMHDPKIQWIEFFHNPLPDGGAVRTYTDITLRKLAEEALKRSEAHFRVIVDAIPSPLLLIRFPDEVIYYANEPAATILNTSVPALIGQSVAPFYIPTNRRPEILAKLTAGELVHNIEMEVCRATGGHFWAIITLALTELNQEQIIVVGLTDISERRDMEEALRYANEHLSQQLTEIKQLQHQLQEQAIRDSLTGLFNRRYLDEMLEAEMLKAKRAGYPLSLILLDIDHFKKLNDTYGHQAGDEVLQKLGILLKEQVGERGLPCRYGGEEFLIVFPKLGLQATDKFAQVLRLSFENLVVHFGDFELKNTLSLGVATYPGHGKTPTELIELADQALYQAKRNGRNQVVIAQRPAITIVKN